jgi:hypothetical protein
LRGIIKVGSSAGICSVGKFEKASAFFATSSTASALVATQKPP